MEKKKTSEEAACIEGITADDLIQLKKKKGQSVKERQLIVEVMYCVEMEKEKRIHV